MGADAGAERKRKRKRSGRGAEAERTRSGHGADAERGRSGSGSGSGDGSGDDAGTTRERRVPDGVVVSICPSIFKRLCATRARACLLRCACFCCVARFVLLRAARVALRVRVCCVARACLLRVLVCFVARGSFVVLRVLVLFVCLFVCLFVARGSFVLLRVLACFVARACGFCRARVLFVARASARLAIMSLLLRFGFPSGIIR